jgi:cytochrome c biogenesis protein CcmG/thiol:disulfide interchange protein DsbE
VKAARLAGMAVFALLGVLFLANAAWIMQNCERLRPIGRGDVAPSLPLPRVDGQGTLALADLRGKVVLVDFWATWCKPCEMTVPIQKRLVAKYAAQGFAVWSVNEDVGANAPAVAAAYARSHQLPFPVVHDHEGLAGALFKAEAYPHLVVVDRRGVVRQVNIGIVSLSKLEEDLDSAIQSALSP